VQKFEKAALQGPKCSFPKKSTWVGQLDQSSPTFLHPPSEGLYLITCFSDFRSC